MVNFRLTIAYDGARYSGWQRQGNTGRTIQGRIEQALSEMAGHAVQIHGAGRTDAGVHALAQVAHVRLNTSRTPAEIQAYLTRYLPSDIAVTSCEAADERFHARLNACGKHYRYRIWNSEIPSVFERKYLFQYPAPLDDERMRQGAAHFIGTHDFRAFCANKRTKKSTVRTLHSIEILRLGSELRLELHGTGFLQHMVRILAGTLLETGAGTRSPDSLPAVLAGRDRAAAGITLPPQGLFLVSVDYAPAEATPLPADTALQAMTHGPAKPCFPASGP